MFVLFKAHIQSTNKPPPRNVWAHLCSGGSLHTSRLDIIINVVRTVREAALPVRRQRGAKLVGADSPGATDLLGFDVDVIVFVIVVVVVIIVVVVIHHGQSLGGQSGSKLE